MTDNSIVVVRKVLDNAWADHVSGALIRGEGDGYFTAPRIHPGHSESLLAFNDREGEPDDIAGILTYSIVSKPLPPTFFVGVIYVSPERRRLGIGKRLMEAAAELAVATKCSDFGLHVMASNTSMLALLEKVQLQNRRFNFHLTVIPEQ